MPSEAPVMMMRGMRPPGHAAGAGCPQAQKQAQTWLAV
jgi:hypothetical protein